MHNTEAYTLCRHCMNRKVRITTEYGHELEGVIVNLDQANVYLQMPRRALFGDAYIHADAVEYGEDDRPFFGGTSSQDVILTLSLFLLLTIVLL
jgi:hypothetical protein